MAAPSKDELFARIRAALADCVRWFLEEFRCKWSGETMYSFLFEVSCEGNDIYGAAATEEGLVRVAQQYASNGYRPTNGDTLTALQTWLRWAGPEDGWFQGIDEGYFDGTGFALDEAFVAKCIDLNDGQLNTVALETLRDLDSQGVFGSGAERDRVVIGMCYIGGDNSDEEFLEWAEQVNPPSVMSRLRREIKASREMGEQIPPPRR